MSQHDWEASLSLFYIIENFYMLSKIIFNTSELEGCIIDYQTIPLLLNN